MPGHTKKKAIARKKKAISVAKDMLKGKRKKPLLVSKNKIKRDIKRKTKAIARKTRKLSSKKR
tara:strand:- start:611 stop:799 length:189 start_codon:yes stop_codon:yes gene_type:complete